MLNFRNKDDILPSALIALSLLVLAGTLAYMLLVPPPNAAGVVKGRERSKRQIQAEVVKAKAKTAKAKASYDGRLWSGNADTVLAQTLAQLTTRANRYHLKMGAFRPQKSNPLGSLTELPCTVQVSGPYPTVVSFLSSLDAKGTRIALRSAQIAAADGATGAVTAMLGLSVYYTAAEESSTPRAATASAGKGGNRG
jgi:Tfp pilus assembly protein PilO